ncbi:MAG: bifunctional (p)ppGpp synthetase/guanosine-3',5'-bis(diphosphate) 3'-pyrophosphohydrolase [Synergistaceae bacterium]|nr:bifunctional (p)ppGpp synthetase/guanosine-3',5'-bis(diphosphate) 3'-pyrophosphohydrolase [Synergistaceae bacterium]
MRSMLDSVPALQGNEDLREMSALRDAFLARIPRQSLTEGVKTCWQELWAKALAILTPSQMQRLGAAFVFAAEAHANQQRKSGDPYIIHTLNAALILAGMRLDLASLIAALLHDVIEDTEVTRDELRDAFGEEVLTLVDGVTKLGKLPFMTSEDYQAENLRKMFIVMARDIRVVLIKLADRLHNMRTLGVMRREKQQRIARETLEIFAPLAHRLGIYQLKRELEDLSFRYLQPEVYNEIRYRVKQRLPQMEDVVGKGIEALERRLEKEGISCRIKGRTKHYYSIYEKMQRKNLSLDELYDILAVRVLVDDVSTCYAVLGIVHAMWAPIPGQFDDYIATPKSNMYQSLHTTVMAFGAPLEVQIRTYEMNHLAEYGIAAHWLYKSKGVEADSLDERLMWVRQALEAEQGEGGGDSGEFLELLKSDILTSEVYVFTPQGRPMTLPNGATTLDFAYAVHTEVGHRCVGAMINGRIVPLNTALHNGDMVKIITSPQGTPSQDWLQIARSSKTRSKIRAWFRQAEKVEREEKLSRGWEALEREVRRRGIEVKDPEDFTPALNKVARDLGISGKDDLLVAVGAGSAGPGTVAQRLILAYLQQRHPTDDLAALMREGSGEVHATPRNSRGSDVLVDGEGGVGVTLASCCDPVPGDDIVGYSTQLRGITVHRSDCPNIKAAISKPERIMKVSWVPPGQGQGQGKLFMARLKAEGMDRAELLSDVARAIGTEGGSIAGVKAVALDNSMMRMKIELRVRNLEHLYAIVGKLNEVKGILEVTRG